MIMGAGSSIPTSEAEALAAGYSQEQIEDFKAKSSMSKDGARAKMMSLMFPETSEGSGGDAQLAEAFKKFDEDGSGELEEQELIATFTDLATSLLNMADMDPDVSCTNTLTE